jgi:hypothetical protein
MLIAQLFRDGTVFAMQEQLATAAAHFCFSRDCSMLIEAAPDHEQSNSRGGSNKAKPRTGRMDDAACQPAPRWRVVEARR